MATTVAQGFDQLRKNLEITSLQTSTVSIRQTNVRNAVEAHLTVLDSFLTGSYRRSTMIAPLSQADIDIFVVLDAKYYHQYNQAGLLDKVRRVLLNEYPKTPKISRNGQAVTITFTDFKVDVVPAFYRNGGGFLIPDTIQSRWISTDPKRHIDIWTAANTKQEGRFIPLVKMLKCWNREHNSLLFSFHLEVLALNIFANRTISTYSLATRTFFEHARALISYPLSDPAGYGTNIGGYLAAQGKQNEASSLLEAAYSQADHAVLSSLLNVPAGAYKYWRQLFGSYFPSYG